MDYTGPSGDEARALLREIRSFALLQTTHAHGTTRGSRGSPLVARSSTTGGSSALSPQVFSRSSTVGGAAVGATQRQARSAATRADLSGYSDRSQADFSMDQELSNDI